MRHGPGSQKPKRFLVAAAVLLAVVCARPAFAKRVSIEWSPLPGATSYELEVRREGKTLSRKRLEESSWRGELPFGIYAYQIRAYDRIKRPGQWTALMPLVVMPAPPAPKSPDDGKKVVLFNAGASTVLRWSPIPGASLYRVEVKRNGAPIALQTLAVSELTLKGLAAGVYSWKITAIVKPRGRVPASFESRQWESKPSEASEFTIEHAKLEAPSLSAPLGSVLPPADGNVKFKWRKVDGAESYELAIFPREVRGRGLASELRPIARVKLTDNVAIVKLPREGRYVWKVRALANIDEKKKSGAVGPQSVAEFKLDKNASLLDGSGYVALSMMLAPYNYQVISAAAKTNGSAASAAMTLRGSGEYWFRPQWGVGTAFESTAFQIADGSYNRLGFELVGKYRFNFGGGRYSWSLTPKLGVEERDYVEIFPAGLSIATTTLHAYGAQLGVDIRKQFSERFSLGGKVAYFLPLFAAAPGVSGLTSDASYRNLSLGLQGLYWVGRHWGLGVGAYVEARSISFGSQGTPAGTAAEQVFMNGAYFFGSLIYSFGR